MYAYLYTHTLIHRHTHTHIYIHIYFLDQTRQYAPWHIYAIVCYFIENLLTYLPLALTYLFVLDLPRLSSFKNTTSSYDLLNSLIYLLLSQFMWDTVSQICHINQNFDGFVYNHSFFNPNIYNICIGIYLTASTLEHQLMWWEGDKLLLMDFFSLVLLWLYMAEINSTVPVDYCGPKKISVQIQGQLVFFYQLH